MAGCAFQTEALSDRRPNPRPIPPRVLGRGLTPAAGLLVAQRTARCHGRLRTRPEPPSSVSCSMLSQLVARTSRYSRILKSASHHLRQVQHQRLLLDPQLPRAGRLWCAPAPPVTHDDKPNRRSEVCAGVRAQRSMRTWTRPSWRSSSRRMRATRTMGRRAWGASSRRCERARKGTTNCVIIRPFDGRITR